jgi:hypothetical protein
MNEVKLKELQIHLKEASYNLEGERKEVSMF